MLESKIINKALESFTRKDIIIIPELCPTVRSPKSKCRRCVEFCPAGSISIENNISIDDKCIECGCCISACPNGVFDSETKNDFSIISIAEDFLKNNPERVVRFTCEKGIEENVDLISLKCVGRLTENILIHLVLKRSGRIEIKVPDCKGCSIEKGKALFHEIRQLAIFIIHSLGLEGDSIQVLGEFSEFKKGEGKVKREENLNRRKFFERIKSKVMLETTNTLANLYKSENKEEIPGAQTRKFQNHKRPHLVSLLKDSNQEEKVLSPDTFIPFATAFIRENCMGCNVCDVLCPTGAISRISDEAFIKIYFNEQRCTNCRLCQDVCLVKAIGVQPRLSMKKLTEDKMVELVRLKKRVCHRCKGEFVGTENICPLCEKRRRNL